MARDSDLTLDRLLAAGEARATGSRAALFDHVAELFIAEDHRLTERERAQMTDILDKLVREVETAIRHDLAERLSRLPAAPAELVTLLANDEIDVALPILKRSRLLADPDLIEIIRNRGREHRLAIAMGRPLSEDVTDVLVDVGEEDVVAALIGNPDARLSRRALSYLVAESERVDRFQEPLVRRADLPPDLAHRMFWFVSAALRRAIMDKYALPDLLLDDHLTDSTETMLASPPDSPPAARTAAQLVDRLAEDALVDPRFLLKAVRSGRLELFIAGLARRAGLGRRQAERLVHDMRPEGVAVALRAIDCPRADFATIHLLLEKMLDGAGARRPEVVTRALDFYDGLDAEVARATLAHWRRAAAYMEATRTLDAALDRRNWGPHG